MSSQLNELIAEWAVRRTSLAGESGPLRNTFQGYISSLDPGLYLLPFLSLSL
jgi:hypothetical protein